MAIACLIMLSVLPCFSQAPELSFKRISSDQGLSNSTIESIWQDHQGFMWFGTRDGLNRYDGYQTTVYRFEPKDSTSISDNYITCIYEDRHQTLWIGTLNGLNTFDAAKHHFIRYKHLKGNAKTIPHNQVTSISEDQQGRLWIGTFGGGISQFLRTEKSFISIQQAAGRPGLSDNRVNAIYTDTKGDIWIGTEKGLDLFRGKTGAFTFYKTPTNSGIRNVTADKEGNLWLGTEDKGLLKFQPQTSRFQVYQHQQTDKRSLGSNQVRSMLRDRKGELWVGGVNGGLNLFDPATNSFFNYQNEPDNIFSLSQRTVSALFEDKQENLWVGTHRGGINLHTPTTSKFKLFRQGATQNSLSYNDVKAFCEDHQGNIWIGTDGGGLNLFQRKNESFTHFVNNPYNAGSIGSNEILHVSEDSEKNIWVSTWGDGLKLLKPGSSRFQHFRHDPSDSGSISSNYVQKCFEDSNGNLWIATYYGGLNRLDRNTKIFTRITTSPDGKSRLLGNNVVSLAEDRQGYLWIGTDDGGLNRYDPVQKTFHHYFNEDEKSPDLRVVFIDSKGRLWVGQAGLYLFNEVTNVFSLATNEAGLGTEFIKGITQDDDGYLWISTSNGLTQFHPEKKTYKKYNLSDGLQGLEFEANAYLKTKDGQMFFGGVNGFNSFYPRHIRINQFVPPVRLTEFQVFNQKVQPSMDGPLQTDISLAKEIKLNYRQSTLAFGFAALNYTASENNQYAYKLEGLEDNWNYVGREHRASYTNLDPGTYTFQVKASNNDGVWNEEGTSIKVIITPPFWQTWWFRTLLVMAFFSAIIAFVYLRRREEMKKLEERKREEIHQMQLQFFTNISHEFRTPLSLIAGPLEKLQKENNQPGLAHYYQVMHRNVNRLLELINELMDFRKAETGALKLRVMPGNLALFLQEIEEEFSELAHEKRIRFDVHIPAETGEVWFDRQVLEKIVVNLVSNSFKYTADGGWVKVEVLTSLEGFKPSYTNELVIKNEYEARRYVYLKVSDNGIGISGESIRHLFERYYRITETHMGSGVGLAFVKSLTTLHKGNIRVYSERNKGTEIIIALPVDREDYTKEEKWIKTMDSHVGLESVQYRYEHSTVNHEIPAKTSNGFHRQSILIVDDNAELRKFIKDSLQEKYQVSEAKDGMEGLKQAREIFPDLVISDVMMPVMDGVEFCKRLKDDIEVSHIPFMMLTARDAPESRLEGVGSGADFYFSKPVSIDLLLLTIRNIFEQKQKLKERYTKDHHAEAKDLVHSARDKEFMEQLLAVIDAQLTNPELDVALLCTQIGMSRTKLYQKIKSITGQSITDFVRTIRLRKAVEIMTHEDVSLSEVIFRVGIQTQSYFTKAFKKEFGKTPTQFLQELKK